jgi:diamine N-acetyltransferase
MNYYLREINKEDIPKINQWRNDKELIDLLGNNFLYIAEEVDDAWYENYLKNRNTAVRLAIVDKDNSILIGTVQLTSIHPVDKSAEFSIMLGEKSYRSKGLGLMVTKTVLDHGFLNLNLHRIYLTVLEYNERAIKMYENAGFRREGILREAIFKNGSFHDLIVMSILNADRNGKKL